MGLLYLYLTIQISPLYWRYTVPNVSSIVGMLPGTTFCDGAQSSYRIFLYLFYSLEKTFFQSGLSVGKGQSLLGLRPENRVDGTQRISDVLPDYCA
jgi:hypothetical protein